MSSEKPKAWIYRGELRFPKPGDHYALPNNGWVYTAPDDVAIQRGVMILEPIPDDVVLVPREKIEALREARDQCERPTDGRLHVRVPHAVREGVNGLLACVAPAKPRDAILEALVEVRDGLDPGGAMGAPLTKKLNAIIAARERELEGRK